MPRIHKIDGRAMYVDEVNGVPVITRKVKGKASKTIDKPGIKSMDEMLDDQETRELLIKKLEKYGYRTTLIADYYIYEVVNGKLKFVCMAMTESYALLTLSELKRVNPLKIYILKFVGWRKSTG